MIKIVETVRVSDGAGWAEFAPTNRRCLDLDVEIAFPGAIGRQRIALPLAPSIFAREIASARSFGFLRDAEQLWRQGLALGASLENSVIFDGDRVLNPRGLRFPDEMARHKMLDVIGDLALAGAAIHGAFRSYRGGHGLNLALIERLMTTPSAYVLSKEAEGSAPRVAAPRDGGGWAGIDRAGIDWAKAWLIALNLARRNSLMTNSRERRARVAPRDALG